MKKIKPIYALIVVGGLIVALFVLAGYQNVQATQHLEAAKEQDTAGKLSEAKKLLEHTSLFLVTPGLQKAIHDEVHRNQSLVDTANKLAKAKQLIKENKPDEALNLLKTLQPDKTDSHSQDQAASLKQDAQKKIASGSTSGSKSSSSGSSGGSTGGSTGGGSTGGGGSAGGNTPPPPPGPMTSISITNLTAGSTPLNASSCYINQSVSFSANGSGSVSVVWKVLSTRTASAIYNPITYTFGTAGSQSDSENSSFQGLEPGDSYRISVVVVNQSNSTITASAGPVTVSNCAGPPALVSPGQPSNMTAITPGTLSSSQNADGLFVNECSMVFHASYSVDSSGTVQAVYTITSGSSGGKTLYATPAANFTGAGSATDTAYVRMPHLNGGDSYSISVKLIDVGNQSIFGTAGPISSGCS